MNSVKIALVAVITIIIIYYYIAQRQTKQIHTRKIRKYKKIAQLDEPEARKACADELDARIRALNDLDSDELFTRATLYLREQDDIQDQILSRGSKHAGAKMRAALIKKLAHTTKMAQETIRLAIKKRNNEHDAGGFIFHNDAIDRRANEINAQARLLAPIVGPIAQQAQHTRIDRYEPTTARLVVAPQWSPDPENVHDSALGDAVAQRLNYLRQKDQSIIQLANCGESITTIMNDRLPIGQRRNNEKRERIERTLVRAINNDYCGRYKIGELEALRLVLENACHAQTLEQTNNLHDAILNSLADCALGTSDTVCLIGRISRYISSLDGIDDTVGFIKTVDTYRAEILNSIGKIYASGVDDERLTQEINKICDSYKDQLPEHSLQKIRNECMAVINDD